MMKGVILVAMFLVGSATFGNSLECYDYSGNLEDFKNTTKDRKYCVGDPEEIKCFKLVVNDEGTVLVTLGCAREEDYTAAKKTCAQVMKDNEKDEMKTTCETKWCNESLCNEPPHNAQCYSCFSTTSMKDCKDMSKPMFCGSPDDRCYKLSSMVTYDETEPSTKIMRYAKGCYSEQQCNKDKNVFMQGCTGDDDCDLNCCDGKMCNAGSFPAASALTMLACVVVYAFRL